METENQRGIQAVLALMLAFGCAGANGTGAPETGNTASKYVIVQFMDASIQPSVARVLPGGDVVWRNNTTNMMGVVVLPASIKQSFTCEELRPRFERVAAGYRSEPITGEVEKVTLPCPLKPGSYSYEVHLFEANFGGLEDPVRTLPGQIVVE